MADFEIKPGTEGTVSFADLAYHKQLPGEANSEFLERINDPTKWIYGSELRDQMFLKNAWMRPRLAHLSRKAFTYYAGERYNPHTVDYLEELQLRDLLQGVIEYKVFGKLKYYDWDYLKNFLPFVIGNILNIEIPYDKKRLDEGLSPEFKSPYHGLELEPPN